MQHRAKSLLIKETDYDNYTNDYFTIWNTKYP